MILRSHIGDRHHATKYSDTVLIDLNYATKHYIYSHVYFMKLPYYF